MTRIIIHTGLILALSGLALGCDGLRDCVCTSEFRSYTVAVVDGTGAPVSGLAPTITLVRTGQRVMPRASAFGNMYPVFTDDEVALVGDAAEAVRFAVTGAPGTATADFVFDVDRPCRCHIRKVSGPDTVTLQ